jgi:hypothetical protein
LALTRDYLIDAIQKINEAFTLTTPDGSEMKFFALEFLISEYLPEISKEKLKLNSKLLDSERRKMFMYQIAMAKLSAKYDPEMNIDPNTGGYDTETIINNAEKVLGTHDDTEMLAKLNDEDEEDMKEDFKKKLKYVDFIIETLKDTDSEDTIE